MSDLVQWHDIALPQVKPPSEPPWRDKAPARVRPTSQMLTLSLRPSPITRRPPRDAAFVCGWDTSGEALRCSRPLAPRQ